MTNTAEGLPKTLPRRPIRQQVFPYFCLFLLGLMMALPFLQPVRVKPLTPFIANGSPWHWVSGQALPYWHTTFGKIYPLPGSRCTWWG